MDFLVNNIALFDLFSHGTTRLGIVICIADAKQARQEYFA
jgi:hypothetical protein